MDYQVWEAAGNLCDVVVGKEAMERYVAKLGAVIIAEKQSQYRDGEAFVRVTVSIALGKQERAIANRLHAPAELTTMKYVGAQGQMSLERTITGANGQRTATFKGRDGDGFGCFTLNFQL